MPGYNRIWRWHFYAGLFCLPFVLWLSLTGSIYLFRPQIEAALDRPYTHLALNGVRASAAAQAAAAVRAVPGSTLHRYQLPERADDAVQVIVGRHGVENRVYVHPTSLAILKVEQEQWRPMRVVFRLHGELMADNWGSYLVELAASWAIVMIVTGLYLWWPRGRRGPAGLVWPRFGRGRRALWRDLHAVTGLWVSAFALFLLVSGLPWAKSWGSYFEAIRTVAEGSAPKPDWPVGAGTRAMAGDHAEHGGIAMDHPTSDPGPLDAAVVSVLPLGLASPVLIAPPAGHGQPWTAKSDAANRPLRTDLTLDGHGRILTRKDFDQRRLMDRMVGYGVAAHEGQLFGVVNQLLGLFTALGLALMVISSVVLWWRRRPDGVLGAPPSVAGKDVGAGMIIVMVVLGLALPLLGVSMIAVLLTERIVLVRLPRAARWLGLAAA